MMRPARMSTSRSQRSASSMTWLYTMIVAPPSASARKTAHSSARSTGSRPTVGSSSTRARASRASRPRARRGLLAAAERVDGLVGVAAEADLLDDPVDVAARRADEPGEVAQVLAGPSGRRTPTPPACRTRRGRRCARFPPASPSTVTVPPSIFCTPTIERMRVVLPQPEGPSRPVIWPRGMSSSSPANTWFLPRRTRSPHFDGVRESRRLRAGDELFITR